MPFVQSCVLCGDHKQFMHEPHLTACPTCGAPYCRSCYNELPKVKVGLLKTQPQCPRCAQASAAARAPYAAYPGQPFPAPPSPAPSVVVVPPMYAPPYPPGQVTQVREIVKVPCRYCGNLVENTAMACPNCSAPLR